MHENRARIVHRCTHFFNNLGHLLRQVLTLHHWKQNVRVAKVFHLIDESLRLRPHQINAHKPAIRCRKLSDDILSGPDCTLRQHKHMRILQASAPPRPTIKTPSPSTSCSTAATAAFSSSLRRRSSSAEDSCIPASFFAVEGLANITSTQTTHPVFPE